MRIPPPQKNKKRALIIPLAILLLLVAGYLNYAYFSKTLWPFNSGQQAASYKQDDSTPGTVRTIEDDAESQDAKKRLLEEQKNPRQPSKEASVTITSADIIDNNLEVRAFTDSIVEAGECTVTVTKGPTTKTTTSPAFIDAKSTICEPLTITTSQLSSGTWKVVASIKTASVQGQSDAVEVTIP